MHFANRHFHNIGIYLYHSKEESTKGENNMSENRLQEMHEMVEILKSMGASEDNIKALWAAALETTDKIIKNA